MPKQNGVSECKNITLVESTRCMLHASKLLPNLFWANVVATLTYYIQNQLFSRAIEVSKTPLTLWCGKTPNLSHLHIFSYLAYVNIPNELDVKELEMKTHKCALVGWVGYKVSKANIYMIEIEENTYLT
jgi:hypothetical protein